LHASTSLHFFFSPSSRQRACTSFFFNEPTLLSSFLLLPNDSTNEFPAGGVYMFPANEKIERWRQDILPRLPSTFLHSSPSPFFTNLPGLSGMCCVCLWVGEEEEEEVVVVVVLVLVVEVGVWGEEEMD